MRKNLLLMALLMTLLVAVLPASGDENAPESTENATQAADILPYITLPPGFEITLFYDQVPGARSMTWTPNGTLFVGTRQAGLVYALRDDDQNYVADGVLVIARGLNSPNGVAFKDGSLYVAEIHRILRYDNIEANLSNPPQPVVVATYPPDQHHGWKFIRFGPDEKLYIPIGVPCNVCETVDNRYGTITRINPDGTEFEIYASGIRNSVGFDWHPETGELWFTDNGRDSMGDNLPPDELNRITALGDNFGFPYCHAGDIPDPAFGAEHACTEFTAPMINLNPHGAALGMRFYTGDQFPEEYLNQVFIAEHGSFDRTERIGYQVSLVRLNLMGEVTSFEGFATGWLQPNATLGRPVDIEQLPDGSLLVSDDFAGAIYRIAYVGE